MPSAPDEPPTISDPRRRPPNTRVDTWLLAGALVVLFAAVLVWSLQ